MTQRFAILADVHGNLTALEAVLADLERFPIDGLLCLGGLRLLAYHGSPKSFDDPIRATTAGEALDGFFEGQAADLYLGAHTHEQFARRYRASIVANPGSVGLAFRADAGGGTVNVAHGDRWLEDFRPAR